MLTRVALPLIRPALVTVVLLTFIGPWNEFLWPFLITKRADLQPLAVSLANYISNVAGSAANPFGAVARRCGGAGGAGGDLVYRLPAVLRGQRPRCRGEGVKAAGLGLSDPRRTRCRGQEPQRSTSMITRQ